MTKDEQLMDEAAKVIHLLLNNLHFGMSKSIQRLCARENQDILVALNERLAGVRAKNNEGAVNG